MLNIGVVGDSATAMNGSDKESVAMVGMSVLGVSVVGMTVVTVVAVVGVAEEGMAKEGVETGVVVPEK